MTVVESLILTVSCGCKSKPNLLNSIFGELIVIEKYGIAKDRCVIWSCMCSCNNIINFSTRQLKSGKKLHCGCLDARTKEDTPLNSFYRNYKGSALRRNLVFLLTKEELHFLAQQNCYYCNEPPKQIHNLGQRLSVPYIYNGIDRKDSKIGYTKENCVPCCKYCNYGKRDLSEEQYIEHCNKVSSNSKKD